MVNQSNSRRRRHNLHRSILASGERRFHRRTASLAILCLAIAAAAGFAAASDAGSWPTTLVDAARRGDSNAVHRLLADGVPPDARDGDGFTALHWAAIGAHWRVFSELIQAGAPVDAVGGDGGTPLHWACHHDRPDMVAQLLDADASVDIANRWGRTPLHVASRRGCVQVAALLLDRGALIHATTREGWTPLHVAYRSDHPEMVNLLLARGADPSRLDAEGLRPAASYRPRPSVVDTDPVALDEFVGLYDLGSEMPTRVWMRGDVLQIREFAPDVLEPAGGDLFICRREPWTVRFRRGNDGRVDGIEVDFLRRTVVGNRLPSPRYVGSAACRTCHDRPSHRNQYVTWLQSRHSHAYWRLAADWALYLGRLRPQYADLTDPRHDERCLLCHVTSAQDPDALRAASYRLEEGIGCESCHGPGSLYMDPAVMSDRDAFLANGGRIPDQRTCRSCHRNPEHFSWESWWPKIEHGDPAG